MNGKRDDMGDTLQRWFSLRNVIFAISTVMFVWLVRYFYTGSGGPRELATLLVPFALLLQILLMYEQAFLYGFLPPVANRIIVVFYAAICVYGFYYFFLNYEEIAIYRQGSYTTEDFVVGLLMFLLVMELSRLAHPVLFGVNLFMIFYTLWGYLSPIDFFWHPGTTFYRVVTSSTVELATGIYGLYAQLALTLVAAFLLLAAIANGFGAQRAMINVMRRFAGRNRQMVPQTAVLGSLAVGMVSGSGSANAVVVGSITIPLMKRYGVPGVFAGAVETAASMGGLIMPPMMGVGAFLMSEFLGVPYWDVVLRGFALAFVYYSSLAFAVYLLCVRLLPRDVVTESHVPLYDLCKTAIFFLTVLFLILMMGHFGIGELRAALYSAIFMLVLLMVVYLFFKFALKAPELADETLLGNLKRAVETHGEMTSYLTLLLATLGIMIGLFTVTGFINRMGATLLDLGAWNIIAMILMAYLFGWLAGAGLPPTATYIIGAIVIVGPLRDLGINPWVAHFFVFLLSVWGELSPPTSLTAAVSARIAEASFMRTMWEALKICVPITLMTFAIFTRSEMVVTPGWSQIVATLLVAISTWGITFAMFGRYTANPAANILLRSLTGLISLIVMLHPDQNVALAAAVPVLAATLAGVWRHSSFGQDAAFIEAAHTADLAIGRSDYDAIISEARREV